MATAQMGQHVDEKEWQYAWNPEAELNDAMPFKKGENPGFPVSPSGQDETSMSTQPCLYRERCGIQE